MALARPDYVDFSMVFPSSLISPSQRDFKARKLKASMLFTYCQNELAHDTTLCPLSLSLLLPLHAPLRLPLHDKVVSGHLAVTQALLASASLNK